jgi:FkbM family methyltransferase
LVSKIARFGKSWLAIEKRNFTGNGRSKEAFMPIVQLQSPDGRFRSFEHRDSPADLGVFEQIFVAQDYSLGRLRRGREIIENYDAIIASGRTPIIVDAGANIGASVVYWALHFPAARILAIEPNPANFRLLKKNTEGLNVVLHEAAIGSFDGSASLIDPGEGEWGYRTSRNDTGSLMALSMTGLLERHAAENCKNFLVKIDIEGAEADLFASHTDWVDSFDLQIIELHDWLMPKQGTSRNFLRCIAGLDRDFVHIGENIFSIKN